MVPTIRRETGPLMFCAPPIILPQVKFLRTVPEGDKFMEFTSLLLTHSDAEIDWDHISQEPCVSDLSFPGHRVVHEHLMHKFMETDGKNHSIREFMKADPFLLIDEASNPKPPIALPTLSGRAAEAYLFARVRSAKVWTEAGISCTALMDIVGRVLEAMLRFDVARNLLPAGGSDEEGCWVSQTNRIEILHCIIFGAEFVPGLKSLVEEFRAKGGSFHDRFWLDMTPAEVWHQVQCVVCLAEEDLLEPPAAPAPVETATPTVGVPRLPTVDENAEMRISDSQKQRPPGGSGDAERGDKDNWSEDWSKYDSWKQGENHDVGTTAAARRSSSDEWHTSRKEVLTSSPPAALPTSILDALNASMNSSVQEYLNDDARSVNSNFSRATTGVARLSSLAVVHRTTAPLPRGPTDPVHEVEEGVVPAARRGSLGSCSSISTTVGQLPLVIVPPPPRDRPWLPQTSVPPPVVPLLEPPVERTVGTRGCS